MNNNLEIFLESYVEGSGNVTIEEERKPNGYWKEWENVERELKQIIKQVGHFPTQKEIKDFNQVLPSVISKYHDGLIKVRELMGYELNRRPNGYWTLENTLKECKKLINEYGYLPAQNQLKELGLSSISRHIEEHGGFIAIRKKLNIEGREKYPKKYWNDEENIIKEYKRLTDELGYPPSNKELCKSGHGGLADAITKRHSGIRNIKQKIGYEETRKYRYWSLEKVLELSQEIVNELGYLPYLSELKEYKGKYKGLVNAVNRIGIEKVRELLKVKGKEEPQKINPDGYWTKENTLKEARNLIKELGYLPTGNELRDMGKTTLGQSISKYFGYFRLRKELGLEQIRVENGYWTEERILEECQKVIDKYGDVISNKKLNSLGFKSLNAQISHRKNGFSYYREKLELEEKVKPKGYWKEWENVERELKQIIKQVGHFPSHSEISESKLSTLALVICEHHGGTNVVREKMGYNKIEIKKDKFKNWEVVKNNLEKLIEELGHFPSGEEIRKKDLGILVDAIYSYHEGLEKVREKMGYESATIDYKKYADREDLINGLKELWKKHPEFDGKIPSENWMRKNGFGTLGQSILRYHGGFIKLRNELNISSLRKADEVDFKDFDNLKSEIEKILEQHPELNGEIPGQNWFILNNNYAIVHAIRKFHGGMRNVRKKLKSKQLRVKNGYYADIENIKNEFEEIYEQHPELNNKMPSVQWMEINGYTGLYHGINKYHGGISSFKKIVGEDLLIKESGYWQDWNNVKKELDDIIKEFGYLPGTWTLNKIGKSSLGMAIHSYHGGMKIVRKRFMNEINKQEPLEYYIKN